MRYFLSIKKCFNVVSEKRCIPVTGTIANKFLYTGCGSHVTKQNGVAHGKDYIFVDCFIISHFCTVLYTSEHAHLKYLPSAIGFLCMRFLYFPNFKDASFRGVRLFTPKRHKARILEVWKITATIYNRRIINIYTFENERLA